MAKIHSPMKPTVHVAPTKPNGIGGKAPKSVKMNPKSIGKC